MNKASLQKRRFNKNLTAYDQVKEELSILQNMDHPNVLFLHEVIDDPKRDSLYLVTDYYSQGSVGNEIK